MAIQIAAIAGRLFSAVKTMGGNIGGAAGQRVGVNAGLAGRAVESQATDKLVGMFDGLISGSVDKIFQIGKRAMQAPLDMIKKTFGQVKQFITDPIGSVHNAFKAFEDRIGQFTRKFKEFGDHLASYVQAANPAYVRQWDLAVRNATAVFGRYLTPAFEGFIKVAQRFGAIANSVRKDLQPLVDTLGRLMGTNIERLFTGLSSFAKLGSTLRSNVAGLLSGVYEVVTSVFKVLEEVFKTVASLNRGGGMSSGVKMVVSGLKTIAAAIEAFANAIQKVRGFFQRLGILSKDATKTADGVAAMPASYTTPEQIGKDLAASSFGMGTGGKTQEEQQTDLLKEIRDAVNEGINQITKAVVDAIDVFPKKLNNGLRDAFKF